MQRDASHIPYVTSGSYPIREGNTVEPLVDGEPAFLRICEAVEMARRSVWVTVAFLERGFEMPGARGSLFDVLDRAVERGLDVRAIFWRHKLYEKLRPGVHFSGTANELDWLRERGSRFLARWDQAHRNYCQHQKSWLIDAGSPDEVAFVGGINLERDSVVRPGHPPTGGGSTHDVYVELRGPSATDVHHNFVQRWNEASDRAEADGAWPSGREQDELDFPTKTSPSAGDVPVQIQRTVRRGRYRDGQATPGGERFTIDEGETSILDQYLQAIRAAQRTIYFENQAIGAPQVVDALHGALDRGVDVVVLVPGDANEQMAEARGETSNRAFWESLAGLGRHENFALVGICSHGAEGGYRNVYVHAKIALVDDSWCTIGSANIGNRSFYGDTELNASFWHGPTVRRLRCDLLLEHLDRDTSTLDDRAAFRLYRDVARRNTTLRTDGRPLAGLAFALDPATYAS